MDIEQSMILKGAKNISDKILSFINTLVIKNRQEADLTETEESFKYYEKLRRCKLNLTDFSDHINDTLVELPIELRNKTIDALNNDLKNRNPVAVETIEAYRKSFIDNYIDKNPYYAILSGNPISDDQIINIIDRDDSDLKFFDITLKLVEYDNYDLSEGNLTLYDVKKTLFPNFYRYLYEEPNPDGKLNIEKDYGIYKKIPLHKIKYREKPNTYTAVYIDGIINKILEDSSSKYSYLNYIMLDLDIEKIREANHFDILWYNPFLLEDKDIDNFFNSYESVKEYVLKNKYIKGLEEMYEHYSNFELMVILFGTFQKMCISYVDTYSVRHYTDREIYDILDSNNLSSLKTVDISILRKIVDNLDILLSYKGTEEVLPKIMEIASLDNALSIKRYDLVKVFKTDEIGLVGLKKDRGMYDKNVDLAFVDRTIASTTTKSSSISADNQIIDYEDFVLRDEYWGYNGKYETIDGKINAVRRVKNDILKLEFNRLETKYIGAVSIINVYDKYRYMTHKIGLLIQFYNGLKELDDINYVYEGSVLTPLQLYTLAACANKHVFCLDNSIEYDDTITPECYSYERMLKLNILSKTNTFDILSNLTFKPVSTGSNSSITVRVGDILTSNEITSSIIFFDSSYMSFKDIIRQYDNNYQKLNQIIINSMKSNDYNTGMAWKTILDYYLITVSNSLDYILPTTFTDFFEEAGGDAFLLFENYIINGSDDNKRYFARTIGKAFKSAISSEINENVEFDDSVESGDKIGSDLNLLIKAFVSIYIELRDVTVNLNMADYPYNTTQFLDRYYISSYSDLQDYHNTAHIYSIYEYSKEKEEISFYEIPLHQERY